MFDRREVLAGGVAASAFAAAPALGQALQRRQFPAGFMWGATTAGHQVEGNNINADLWFLENLPNTSFAEPSGDAANSFLLWPQDLDLCVGMGMNSYRFGIEWSRIEPVEGRFSTAMLDHYRRMIEGCHARSLRPIVTFNHFTAPIWFSAKGGWTNPDAPSVFARFCDVAARALADGMDHAITFNEPNLLLLLDVLSLPQPVIERRRAMLQAAARQLGVARFVAQNSASPEDVPEMQPNLLAAHSLAKAAIKAVRSDLPVGVSLAMFDDQAAGPDSIRNAMRQRLYGAWLDLARQDDFIGVQNYERAVWNSQGKLPAPAGATVNFSGSEVYAASLAGAVRHAYQVAQVPVLVSEHGVGTEDDGARVSFIRDSLAHLHQVIAEGVPVTGYLHWSLIDNFEWTSGYRPRFGLASVDRQTFRRSPKGSAVVYEAIIRANAV